MMRALGVVPVKPVEQFLVEGVQVGEEQFVVEVDEFILESAVEALAGGEVPPDLVPRVF